MRVIEQFLQKSPISRFLNPYKDEELHTQLERLKVYFDGYEEPPAILYLGDSVLRYISWYDRDKRLLGEMVKEEFRDVARLEFVSHRGYQPLIYYHLLRAVLSMKEKPKLLILPVNMRCFSPQWDFNPQWQFEQEIQLIQDFLAHSNKKTSFLNGTVDPDAMEQYDHQAIHYPLTTFKTIREFHQVINDKPSRKSEKDFRYRQIFIFHYLHQLEPSHPKLVKLKEIITILKESNIGVFLYITPINFQAGRKYVGDIFINLFEKNKATLKTALEDPAVVLKDYTMTFDQESFLNPDDPTEHLQDRARQDLAKLIRRDVGKEGFFPPQI